MNTNLRCDEAAATVQRLQFHSGLKKSGYIDDISLIYRVSVGFDTKQRIDYRSTEKSVKNRTYRRYIGYKAIYHIQSDISRILLGVSIYQKIQTKIIED